jgi:hypothetical protein
MSSVVSFSHPNSSVMPVMTQFSPPPFKLQVFARIVWL